ncbi:hypothetical protein J5500_01185 [Candidatus Saccharibacteria bacterium]|nr:hypothetical protein [Candidatus Saccharibacteria bacterium]
MSHFIDVLGPHYQDLLAKCEKRKISVNLDIQDLTINIREVKRTNEFLTSEIKRALRNCGPGDKITLAEANDSQTIRISVKNSGRATLTTEEKYALRALGYEVRARFGYDTIVSLTLDRK